MLKRIADDRWTLLGEYGKVLSYKYLSTDDYFTYWLNGDILRFFPDYNSKTDITRVLGDAERLDSQIIALHCRQNYVENKDSLPAGFYNLSVEGYGDCYLTKQPLRLETYLPLSSESEDLIKDVTQFFNSKHLYKELGITYKRAALLFGSPGQGKTTSIAKVCESVIAQNGVCIFVTATVYDLLHLCTIHKAVGDRPMIIIFEELTNRTHNRETTTILSFLDGQHSIEGVYFIATTNFPEDIPTNLIDRPGRFDAVIEYKHPNHDQRKLFLEHFVKTPITDEDIKTTDGLSLSYLKELSIQTRLNNYTITEAYNKVKEQRAKVSSSFKKKAGIRG